MTNAQPGQATTEPPVLSPTSLAARWHVSTRTVINLILRGDLLGTRIGKQWRVTESDAASYERGRRVTTACPRDTGVAS